MGALELVSWRAGGWRWGSGVLPSGKSVHRGLAVWSQIPMFRVVRAKLEPRSCLQPTCPRTGNLNACHSQGSRSPQSQGSPQNPRVLYLPSSAQGPAGLGVSCQCGQGAAPAASTLVSWSRQPHSPE